MQTRATHHLFTVSPVADLKKELRNLLPDAPEICIASEQARSLICGGQPMLFSLTRQDEKLFSALATMRRGRLRCALFVTVVEEIPDADLFWNGVLDFIGRRDVTELSVMTVATSRPQAAIPQFGRPTRQFANVKLYIQNLSRSPDTIHLSSNHKRNIAKAKKAGIQVMRLDEDDSVRRHFELTGLSLDRREKRGESIVLRASRESVMELLASGAGRLFQAGKEGEVLSSKLVYVLSEYGFYYDGGTSPEGMRLGVSHYLMSEIMASLRSEGIRSLNMGLAAEPTGGLWRYKEGFGSERLIIERARYDFLTPVKQVKNGIRNLFRTT
jgi:hypothetical protein